MKRKIISSLLCACMILSMTACGNKDVPEEVIETSKYKSTVTKLADYKGIKFVAGDVDVTDEELNALLDEAVEAWTHYEPIDKKTVEIGDIVNISYISLLDGEEPEGVSNTSGTGLNIQIGSKTMIDGFEESLIGAKVGETTTVKLTMPNDFKEESLRGKELTFNIIINSIQQIVSYSLSEESAKKQGYESLDAFINNCRLNLVEDTYEDFKYNRSMLLIDYVLSNTTFDLDSEEVEADKQDLLDYYYQLAEEEGIEKEKYIEDYFGMTIEEFETDCLKNAEDNIKYVLAMTAIFEAEEIDIEEFYAEHLDEYTTVYGFSDSDSFINMYGIDQIKIQMMCDKAIEILEENSIPTDKDGNKLSFDDMPVVSYYENPEDTNYQMPDQNSNEANEINEENIDEAISEEKAVVLEQPEDSLETEENVEDDAE